MAHNMYNPNVYQQQPVYQPYNQQRPQQYPHSPMNQPRYPPGPSQYPPQQPIQTQFAQGSPQVPLTPYSPSNPQPQVPPASSALQYHQPQPVVATTPADITQRYANNAYPSPVSPSSGPPSAFRRPLPNPGNTQRPNSVAITDGPPSAFQSRPITHRPSTSMSAASPASSAVASTISRFNNMSMNSAGPTARPSGRPLPTPGARSTKSVDLTHQPNPIGSSFTANQQTNTNSTSHVNNASATSAHSALPELPPAGQKFVPLWKRTLPSPIPPGGTAVSTPSSMPNSPQVPPTTPSIFSTQPTKQNDGGSRPLPTRRQTISSRPLPQSPGASANPAPAPAPVAASSHVPKTAPSSAAASPISQRPPQLPPRRQGTATGPPSPTRKASDDGSSIKSSSSSKSSGSRIFPPAGSKGKGSGILSRRTIHREGSPVRQTPPPSSVASSDDEDFHNYALLQRQSPEPPRTPSPTYGIRDLPTRSPNGSPNKVGESSSPRDLTPTRPRALPSRGPRSPHHDNNSSPTRNQSRSPTRDARYESPTRSSNIVASPPREPEYYASDIPERVGSHIHNKGERQSAIFRAATAELAQEAPHLHRVLEPSPAEEMPKMARTRAQIGYTVSTAGGGKWPTNVAPLPSPPKAPSSGGASQYRNPSPGRTPTKATVMNQWKQGQMTAVQPGRGIPDLDDAPPPSLRRSPSPDPYRRVGGSSYSASGLPSIRTHDAQPRKSPGSSHPPSAISRAPSSATSVISLSQFPEPPSRRPAYGQQNQIQPSYQSYSPPKQQQQRQQQQQRYNAYGAQGSSSRSAIPKISFPEDPDDESDIEFASGPMINVSGPSNSNPIISVGNFDDDDDDDDDFNSFPGISINVADEDDPPIPQISIGGDSGSSPSDFGRPQRPRKRQPHKNTPLPIEKAKGGLYCGGCGGPIVGRIVSAMGVRWHPGCFRCCVCDELLENLSSYEHEGRPYCHLDYHENFAPRCYHCQTTIVDELFITLDDPELGKRTYHEQHFFCAECGDPFLPPGSTNRSFSGDGVFKSDEDDVGFTVYKGHPYCEACHVRLRMPKCKKCKRSIRDGMQAVEALGGKWCWECFVCASCEKPFENPAFFERDKKPFCERCFSIMIRNEI